MVEHDGRIRKLICFIGSIQDTTVELQGVIERSTQGVIESITWYDSG